MAATPTILCIDDEELGLQIRKTVLERAGYRVLTAMDGLSGLSIFHHETIDAVVLDYSMPGMDGSEVAAAMRKVNPSVPIMLLSAYVTVPDQLTPVIDTFLTKGEGPHALLKKVADLLKCHRGHTEAFG